MAKFFFSGRTCNRDRIVRVLMCRPCCSPCAALWPAGGGKVLPPCEFILWDTAVETAVYNVGPRTGTPPKVPFHVLVADATVKPGTILYLPVFFADNAPPPTTPPSPRNQRPGCGCRLPIWRGWCRGLHRAGGRQNHDPVRRLCGRCKDSTAAGRRQSLHRFRRISYAADTGSTYGGNRSRHRRRARVFVSYTVTVKMNRPVNEK